MVAPEFQITTSSTSIAYANLAMWMAMDQELEDPLRDQYKRFNLNAERRLVRRSPKALLARLNLVLAARTLFSKTRATILEAMKVDDDPDLRLAMALYLIMVSPDWNVVR